MREENGRLASITTDHLGTPTEMYDEMGAPIWKARLDLFGVCSIERGTRAQCPFRWPGQYEDEETGLYYNRFRYYDPSEGVYISQDPIRLAGGLALYGYVGDPLGASDPLGLAAEYGKLDGFGRPTSGFADLSVGDLRPTGTSPPTRNPPGWLGGAHPHHQQRSHLVADTLGGSGSDSRNLVTLTDGTNHPGMSALEARIRRYLRADPRARVLLEVSAEYDSDLTRIPDRIRMVAIGTDGGLLFDTPIPNGRRQNVGCCK